MIDGARTLLPELRERVRRIERPPATEHGILPFGVAAIDRALPGDGLARGALHEILGMGGDEEDCTLAAAFAATIIGRLAPPTSSSQPPPIPSPASRQAAGNSPSPPLGAERVGVRWGELRVPSSGGAYLTLPRLSAWAPPAPPANGRRGAKGEAQRGPPEDGLVLWCLARPDLYGPGLAAHGLDPERVVLVRTSRDAEILWAMEEGLRSPGIAAVVGEGGTLPAVARRRLQLAAERAGTTAFLLRRWRNGGQAAHERTLPNAAATRWRITALPSHVAPGEPGVGRPRWRVELLRCRGGEPASWEMPGEREVPDATDHVSLAAALADRPAAPVVSEKLRRAG